MTESALRPPTSSLQGLPLGLAVWLALALSSAQALEPHIVKTERATYKIWQFDKVGQTFELTPDRLFAVGVENTVNGFAFYVLDLKDLSQTGRIPLPLSLTGMLDWKIVGSELYITRETGWHVYRIPDLTKVREIERSPSITLSVPLSSVQEKSAPAALAGGWLDRGLVLDDTATKIIGVLRGCGVGGWVDHSTELLPVRSFETGFRGRPSSASKETSLMRQLPYEVSVAENRLILRQFDSVPLKGAHSGDWVVARAGDHWLSLVTLTGQGIFLSVEDFQKAEEHPTSRFTMAQPSLTLDAMKDWKYTFLDNPRPEICSVTTFPAIGTDGKLDLANGKNYPLLALGKFHSFSQCDEFLNKSYLPQASAEYERVVGQTAEQIPICFEITAKRGNAEWTHFAWSQMSREEILFTFAPAAIQQDPIDRGKELEQARAKELKDRGEKTRAAEERNAQLVREAQAANSRRLDYLVQICAGIAFLTMGVAALGLILFLGQREQ